MNRECKNMYLREYIESDAEKILSWITGERAFRLWSSDRYGEYPIVPDDINLNYKKCLKAGDFYPMTLVDSEENVIGHLILRNPVEDKSIIRLGFIIVDNKVRRKGYGKKLLELAIEYAKEELKAKEISLGVFKDNESAYRCYTGVGFKEVEVGSNAYVFKDEAWDCVEMVLNL